MTRSVAERKYPFLLDETGTLQMSLLVGLGGYLVTLHMLFGYDTRRLRPPP